MWRLMVTKWLQEAWGSLSFFIPYICMSESLHADIFLFIYIYLFFLASPIRPGAYRYKRAWVALLDGLSVHPILLCLLAEMWYNDGTKCGIHYRILGTLSECFHRCRQRIHKQMLLSTCLYMLIHIAGPYRVTPSGASFVFDCQCPCTRKLF